MTKLPALISCFLLGAAIAWGQSAPDTAGPVLLINGEAEFNPATGFATATNGVTVKYGETVLTSQKASYNETTGDIFAEGAVRLQRDNETFTGERLHYNYVTRQIDAAEFRTGRAPLFAAGQGLQGNQTNDTYSATNALITSDDYYNPFFKVRSKYLKIAPNKYFEARNATLYIGDVPVFFFPYYRRSLGPRQNNWSFLPGYRSLFGPYLLTTYNWFLDERLNGGLHLDWRERRGPGLGPDFDFHLGQYGEGVLKYYYTHDAEPNLDANGLVIPENRQRLLFTYDATLRTNLDVKSQVAYQSDPLITHDFFENEYRKNVEPNSFFEVNQRSPNWSLDGLAQPRVNGFFETVERLPDIRLSGFPQQILDTPLYYQSESSAGWYRRLFSDTNAFSTNYSAARADTYHQLTIPETFFGWLTLTPRVGGRFTYYGSASGPGATTSEQERTVFNTGAELSTKASRTWPGVENHFLDLDGLRHIIEPSINYVFVPRPNVLPSQLPQFDYQLTNSLSLLPIEYPDYNAIDSIDSQNVIRYGLQNRLQTKRNGQIEDWMNWSVFTDWRLRPQTGQTTFSDIYSELAFRPRSWVTFGSETRYDIDQGVFQLAHHTITLQPNPVWSWTLGHFYLREGPVFGLGNNLITSTFFYRFDENWGFRISHQFEARDGVLEEQSYSIYRDLRSWTSALTFRILDDRTLGKDYTVAVSFSLKAFPKFGLGRDTVGAVNASSLVGY